MKKGIILGLALVGAMAMSCNKENASVEPSNGTTFTFVSAKPQFENETKTAWENGGVVWKVGDHVRVACLKDGSTWRGKDNNDGTPRAYATDALAADTQEASFSLNGTNAFSDLADGSFVFYASYPYETISKAAFASAPDIDFTLPSTQNFTANTFNANYDVLVGKTDPLVVGSTAQSVDKNYTLNMYWKRVVAHTYITLNNIAVDGSENVTKLTLTAQDGAEIVGTFSYDITNGDVTPTSCGNTLIVDGGAAIVGGSFSTWATILPANVTSLEVELKTNAATYTRTISGIDLNFLSTHRNVLNINMSRASREASAASAVGSFIFNTDAGLSSLGITKPNASAGTDITGPYTNGDVTISFTHGSGTNTRVWNSSGTTSLRVYKNGGTIVLSSSKKITKVVFTASTLAVTPSVGTLSNKTWTGNAETVTFTASNSNTISSIVIGE